MGVSHWITLISITIQGFASQSADVRLFTLFDRRRHSLFLSRHIIHLQCLYADARFPVFVTTDFDEMANPHLRGGDAHMNNLHSSDSDGRDSGDLLNAIGSASSLGSTDSSVFSTNSLAVRSNGNILGAATLTPLTQPSSSPSKPRSPFPAPKSHHRHSMAHPSSSRSLPTHFAPSQNATPYTSSPRDRPHARSRQSANEGYRADNASEENDKLSKEEKSKYTGEVRGQCDNLLSLT